MGGNGSIYVVGLGPGSPLALPPANLALMRAGYPVYLRTIHHPVVPFLEREGVVFSSFDHLYEEASSFEEVYRQMAAQLLEQAAGRSLPVVFAVPGHPLVGEQAVRELLAAAPGRGVRVLVWPAASFLDSLWEFLPQDPLAGVVVLEAFQFCGPAAPVLPPGVGVVVAQVYDAKLAAEVKLGLMEFFPDDHRVLVVRAAGVPGEERAEEVPLYELDRLPDLDHLTTVFVPPLPEGKRPARGRYDLAPLVRVMKRLLGPGGCPWDRQQTHASLKKYLLEETYEVLEAIDEGDMNKLCEELGDLLLQVVFHAVLAEERGDFRLEDVVARIAAKLRRRHPHVFGNRRVKDASEVLANWEEIKNTERKRSLLGDVPRQLPALLHAQKVQAKAALVGFDWPDAEGAAAKVWEEWEEVRGAWERGDREELEKEVGDLLFAVVNVSRLLGIEAEDALRAAVERFRRRFQRMEAAAAARGVELRSLSLGELDILWEEAKKFQEGA